MSEHAGWRHSVIHPEHRDEVLKTCATRSIDPTAERRRCTCSRVRGRRCCAFATQEDRQCDECRTACAEVNA